MSPAESIQTCLSKYLDFDGRGSKSEYWWFFLAILVGSLVCSFVSDALFYIFQLLILVPSFSAGARRLHDTNRTGWWQLIAFIPLGFLLLLFFLAQDSVEEGNRFG